MALRCVPTLLLLLLLLLCAAPIRAQAPEEDPLEQGNRLFRSGRIQEALTTYLAGWDPEAPDPVLAYNLGTTAHHLGRLADAVLWYRRALDADTGGADDLWLEENLRRARHRLGAPRLPPPDLSTRLAQHRAPAWILGALAGWVALGLLLVGRRAPRKAADILLLLTALLMATALLLPRLAAWPAVVLEPCGDGALPAGAEVWARSREDGRVSVGTADGTVLCPADTVEPVKP